MRIAEVTDGLTNTVLFGERNHTDPNHDSFVAALSPPPNQSFTPIGTVGEWGNSGGRTAAGDVTIGVYAPINYLVPAPAPRAHDVAPRGDGLGLRLLQRPADVAFGSKHPGGAPTSPCAMGRSVSFRSR